MDLDVSMEGEEEVLFAGSGTSEDNEFDMAVGAIEEILMDGEFISIQNAFCERHCEVFVDDDENKLEYTPIFNDYTRLIETTLCRMLTDRLSGFNMRKFEEDVAARRDEISGEIFDLLLSMGDFAEFKDLMIATKKGIQSRRGASGPSSEGFSLGLTGRGMEGPAGRGARTGTGSATGSLDFGISGRGIGGPLELSGKKMAGR